MEGAGSNPGQASQPPPLAQQAKQLILYNNSTQEQDKLADWPFGLPVLGHEFPPYGAPPFKQPMGESFLRSLKPKG